MPLVRVCAAGVGSVWSWRWRTWRRAFTTGFTLDMLKNVRFLRGLGRMAGSQCADLPSFLPAHLKVINESGVTPSFIHHGEKVTAFPDAVAGGNSNTEDIEYKAALESYEAFTHPVQL